MEITKNTIVGELVSQNYAYANTFKKYGIDFCCNGYKSIAQACEENKLDENKIISELETSLSAESNQSVDFKNWELDLLIDYIIKKHHRYITQKSPEIRMYLERICEVHGDSHPELHLILEIFNSSINDLMAHMSKEENVLFPYIVKLVEAQGSKENVFCPFGTIKNPIQMMEKEHDIEGERYRKIESLSNGFTPPADACNTYRVSFEMLKDFVDDLHLHIHIENNILFPRSIILEESLAQ